jgi:chromosome segregation ATPase
VASGALTKATVA